jgi:hypothetical protein
VDLIPTKQNKFPKPLITYQPVPDVLLAGYIDNHLVLNFQNLITYMDDSIIIQIDYQSSNTNIQNNNNNNNNNNNKIFFLFFILIPKWKVN